MNVLRQVLATLRCLLYSHFTLHFRGNFINKPQSHVFKTCAGKYSSTVTHITRLYWSLIVVLNLCRTHVPSRRRQSSHISKETLIQHSRVHFLRIAKLCEVVCRQNMWIKTWMRCNNSLCLGAFTTWKWTVHLLVPSCLSDLCDIL
jgi:hypothetical protein